MELKCFFTDFITRFFTRFQSYLYGIEIKQNSVMRFVMQSFNRTFMELKWSQRLRRLVQQRVSIVPLWNWNIVQYRRFRIGLCFNRTFMELKLSSITEKASTLLCFNRTFMELKCRQSKSICASVWFQSYLYGIEM